MLRKLMLAFLLLAMVIISPLTVIASPTYYPGKTTLVEAGDILFSPKGVDQDKVVGYDFPVKPGTEKWVELNDYRERVEVSQVPNEVLSKLSTEELIETVLNYPFIVNLFLFNSYEEGFETVLSDFNGLKELTQRVDAGQVLLGKRAQFSNLGDDDSKFEAKIIDIILHQDEVFSKLSTDEKTELGLQNTIVYVYTPEGTPVRAIKVSEEHSQADIDRLDSEIENSYPEVDIERSASLKYNCHSYAFHSTSASNDLWIDDHNDYLEDGSYDRITSYSDADEGHKVDYYGSNHSGIVYGKALGPVAPGDTWFEHIIITSKWGEAGLITHRVHHGPYYDSKYATHFYE